MKAIIFIPVLLLISIGSAAASPGYTTDENKDGRPDMWYEMWDGKVSKMSLDRNYDGRIDYVVEYDAKEQKLSEFFDFNHDGCMDDFYFYEDGQLIRQEIDSNFDERVDIWVYLHQGLYIKRYEMDKDFDGIVDITKSYGSE